jgi:threonine efflux protein
MVYIETLAVIAGVFTLGMITPGPNFLIVSSTAIAVSRWAGVMTGLGVACASVTWSGIAMLGLGIVLTQVAWLYAAIKIAGAAYLLWLGAKMILNARKPASLPGSASPLEAGSWHALRRGYFFSMTNPKAAAFFGSMFVVTIPISAPLWVYLTALALIAMISTMWHCGLALLLSSGPVQKAYRRAKTAIDVAVGAVLVLLGVRLLASR